MDARAEPRPRPSPAALRPRADFLARPAAWPRRHAPALLAVALVLGWAWGPLLSLSFTGEDYGLFARALSGEAVYPHVFRPWSGLLIAGLHALYGVSSPVPYHVVSLLLHLANAALVYALGLALLRSRALAGLAALFFTVGAGVTDSLAWIAAVNRPLSELGALLAFNGLVRLEARPRAALALAAGGLLVQFGANEDFYGTALLACGWCALLALRVARVRRAALALTALAAGALVLHYEVFLRVPGGSGHILATGLHGVLGSATRRTDQLAAGWGISFSAPWLPLLLAAVMALALGPRAALFALAAFALSFVPFALSDAVPYRDYPGQAPFALLLAGAAAELVPGRVDRPRRAARVVTVVLLGGLALLASGAPRRADTLRWERALAEIDACRPDAERMAREAPDRPPTLVNLDTTTAALFAYCFRLGDDVRTLGFLDAVSGCVVPHQLPPEPWYGRRCEGSLGVIEPRRYLATRPHVPPLALYEDAVPVATLDEALERMADGSVDVTRQVLVEAPAALFAGLGRGGAEAGAPGSVEVRAPFAFDPSTRVATEGLHVSAARPAVLADLDEIFYRCLYRISRDQTIFSGVRETRVIELEARTEDGRRLPTFYADGYGLGVLVPAGEHELALRFTVTPPDELR